MKEFILMKSKQNNFCKKNINKMGNTKITNNPNLMSIVNSLTMYQKELEKVEEAKEAREREQEED